MSDLGAIVVPDAAHEREATDLEVTVGESTVGELDLAGYLVRSRRRARLSQREMAARLGLAQSTWAGYERGSRRVPERVLAAALSVAALRLAVVDEAGHEVMPFPANAVRDNAGRRFPAHLEVQPPDKLPREALRSPRDDRQPPRAWYHLRESAHVAADSVGDRDHPTTPELAVRLRRLRTAGAASRASAPRVPEQDD